MQAIPAHEKRMFGCLVCQETRLDTHMDLLLRCPHCGFVTARQELPIDARQLYEGDYFTGDEYLDYRADEPFLRRNFQRRLEHVLKYKSGGRLLEIGAAYGFFMDLARKHFKVLGYEVNPQAVAHGRSAFGLDIRSDDFLAATPAQIGGTFDVTVMWDVIEHLERPDLFLERIARFSKPGAVLCLTTGDIGSRVARWRGGAWRLIHPPSHLHYFDRKTIKQFLAKYGFEVVDIRSVGFTRGVLQTLYSILALHHGMQKVYGWCTKIIPAKWGFALNLGDIMMVTAKKTGGKQT
jgi:SAM-dependent methyltransferase